MSKWTMEVVMPDWMLNALAEDLTPDIGHVATELELIESASDQEVVIDFMEVTAD